MILTIDKLLLKILVYVRSLKIKRRKATVIVRKSAHCKKIGTSKSHENFKSGHCGNLKYTDRNADFITWNHEYRIQGCLGLPFIGEHFDFTKSNYAISKAIRSIPSVRSTRILSELSSINFITLDMGS